MTNIESLSREFAKLAGHTLIDPTDAREVIRVMMGRKDWPEFCDSIGQFDANAIGCYDYQTIDADLVIDQTGLMLKEAVEWLRGRERA